MRATLLCLFLVACGGGSKSQPAPAAPTETGPATPPETAPAETPPASASDDKIAEDAVRVMERIAEVAERNGTDCEKMAAELRVVVEESRGAMEAAKQMSGSEEEQQRMQEKYGARIEAAFMKIMPAFQSCPEAAEVLQEM